MRKKRKKPPIAGPEGAGSHDADTADARQALNIDPYEAAKVADSLRRELVRQRESFVFEEVFSDPAGDKLGFLREAAAAGYTVVLCFIGISGADVSEQRVAMRVTQGGHDVPTEKLESRYPRTMTNLKSVLLEIPYIWIFDNDDLRVPYRLVAVYESGQPVALHKPIPRWLTTFPEGETGTTESFFGGGTVLYRSR